MVFTALCGQYAFAQGDKDSVVLLDSDALDEFYTVRDGAPFWIKKGRLNSQGNELLKILERSWVEGLNPAAYHVQSIQSLLEKTKSRKKNQDNEAEDRILLNLELLLSDAYVHYVRDMSGMRIKPEELGLDASDWRTPVTPSQALGFLKDGANITSLLSGLEPKGQTYQTMKSELLSLLKAEAASPETFKPIHIEGIIRPGRGNGAIPKIREKLGLPEVEQVRSYTYDDALVSAVIAFQAKNGLSADSVIGPQTIEALNKGRKDKILQIIVNMERLRWLSDDKPDRFVVVNLPSATLWAIEDGKVKVEMPVVVGRAERPTPPFRTLISGVRFNPQWTVPPTILEEDILPKLREDPNYLADKGMEIYDGYKPDSQTLDPASIDWNNVSLNQAKALRFVQMAGDNNPLGRIRILMPNRYDVYLHDTNHPELFSALERTQSSGCVRMRYPEKMADFVMARETDWSNEKMHQILKSGKTKDIAIREKIPVFLLYYTAWVGGDGKILYGEDIYDRDKKLLQALKTIDGIPKLDYTERYLAELSR
ncbi:MAG: L,D-transpeptidase family protein [Alphaproteobacteria bacterium]|nr:L,D-transpeptidase family protein [Alphaproteobacteria bacterium]